MLKSSLHELANHFLKPSYNQLFHPQMHSIVDGTVACEKDAKSLLKKCDIMTTRKNKAVKEALASSQTLFEEQNKAKIEVTERLFLTAYEYASSHLSFHEYLRPVDLQTANGLDCGRELLLIMDSQLL